MNIYELEGGQLDYWVMKAGGSKSAFYSNSRHSAWDSNNDSPYTPSTNWSQGGLIIAREGIAVWPDSHEDPTDSEPGVWFAQDWASAQTGASYSGSGPTPLIAAMRAYVFSKYGYNVPDETDC